MFNNLGIYGGTGIPGALIPVIRTRSRRVRPAARRRSAPCAQPVGFMIGGTGNDIINIGNSTVGPPGPPGPPGPAGPAGPPGTPGLVPVTLVVATPFVAALTDYYLAVDVAAPTSIILPVAPTGTVFIIKDIDGDASTNPITVTAATTIDGAASALINADYGSVTLVFNGAEWNIV